MRKRMAVFLAAVLAVTAAGCGFRGDNGNGEMQGGAGVEPGRPEEVPGTEGDAAAGQNTEGKGPGLADFKVGVITADGDRAAAEMAAHLAGIGRMAQKAGLSDSQVLKRSIGEEARSCYNAAAELAEAGCDMIFSCAPLAERELLEAAISYPEVEFAQAKGAMAPEAGVANFHNYGLSFYEASYVAGIVAGTVLAETAESDAAATDIAAKSDTAAKSEAAGEEKKLGYVAARPNAADISRFSAFYLGVRSVCPGAVMEVAYTNGVDGAAEEKALALAEDGCLLIGAGTGESGVAEACGAQGIPYVGEIADMEAATPTRSSSAAHSRRREVTDTEAATPARSSSAAHSRQREAADAEGAAAAATGDTALVRPVADWEVYYTYAVEQVAGGGYLDTDWCRGYADAAVGIFVPDPTAIPAGAAGRIAQAEEALKNGSLSVFDTDTFTVGGQTLEKCIEQGGEYEKYRLYVYDGFFHESESGSAPVFDLPVDGIRVR